MHTVLTEITSLSLGIKERIIFVGKYGLFNHVSNHTLISSINMPNVIESSKTKMILEELSPLD